MSAEEKAGEILENLKGLQENTDTKFAEVKEQGVVLGQRLEEESKRIADLDAQLKKMEKAQVKQRAVEICSEKEQSEMKSVNAHLKSLGRDQIEDADQFAEMKSCVEKYLRKGEKFLSSAEYKTINGIIDPEGGYLVAPQISPDLMARAFDGRQVALNVTNTTIGTSEWKEFVDWNDYNDGVFEDQVTATGSDAGNEDFKLVSIKVGDHYYPKKFHRGTLEDSFVNLDTEVMNSIMMGMMRQQADDVLNGVASTEEPIRGLLTYDSGTSWGQVRQNTSTTNDTIDWDDFLSVLPGKLKDDYHGNAKYAMARATFFSLLIDKDSQGKYQIGNQISFLSTNVGPQLGILGYPVLFDAGMPAVADGALAVAFGDFEAAYRKVNRVGFSIHRDDSNAKFLTLTGKSRVGGDVKMFDALELLVIQ